MKRLISLLIVSLLCQALAAAEPSGPQPARQAPVETHPVDQPAVIVIPSEKRGQAGLALAADDLREALGQAAIVYADPSQDLPRAPTIFLGRCRQAEASPGPPLKPEGFRIRDAGLQERKAVVIEGDERGVMYGTFKLAERIRLGDDPWSLELESTPAFPMRMFSEEGQLLDLPDRNYYCDEPPYVDVPRLRRDVEEAKRLVDHVARLGYNTVTFLHVNCEDYIDYQYLEGPIYPPGDRHLERSPVFCRHLAELCDYAHARHLDVFLQLYEIQYPPEVDRLYGVSLESPNIQRIISAKCRELFERVPLDGLVITPTESHPRCGYRSKHLWAGQGRAGAGRMLTLYHNACAAVGKRAVFRLWRIASDAQGAREACQSVPPEAMFSVKNTGGDYFLNSPITSVITSGLGHEQPLMVVFDTFREYDGWARCFCLMQQWGPRVRACRQGGVQAINAWGAWSPGCIWPDFEPGYLRNPTDEPVAWAGYWNAFRMFTRGFTPGQANAYLLARLSWEPELKVRQIARDFAALHLGPANAEAAAEALMHTQQPWREHYPGDRPGEVCHPVYMKWTMVFGPREARMEEAYERMPLEAMLASNAAALEHIEKMLEAFARTDRSKAPDRAVYDRFEAGIAKTALVLRSLHLYREFWWRKRSLEELEGDAKAAGSAEWERVRAELKLLLEQWAKFPEEAAMWRVSYRYGEPEVYRRGVFPYWWPDGADSTLEALLAKPD